MLRFETVPVPDEEKKVPQNYYEYVLYLILYYKYIFWYIKYIKYIDMLSLK